MLVRVPTDKLVLGMYVASLDGSWFDHPFWRSRFPITHPREIEKLLRSGIESAVIDDEKGIGLGDLPAEDGLAPGGGAGIAGEIVQLSSQGRRVSRRDRRSRYQRTKPCGQAEEIERATAIVDRSKKAVKDMFGDIRLGKTINSGELAPVVEEISSSVARNPYALVGIARLKSAHEYTYMHSVAVCALMINLAQHLGLDERLIRDIGMAGLMHDVGKMTVPVDVLDKAGSLTEAEFAVVKGHPVRGHQALLASKGVPDIALDVCLHHHERIDGKGYPHGLKGDEISLYARMGAVCDIYDAITSARSYKSAWHPADALAKMVSWEGHLDQRILAAFIRSVGIYPVGSLVRLRSDRLAVVIEECPDDLTRPLLRTFYSVSEQRRLPVRTIRIDGIEDRIVGPEDPAAWGFRDWPALLASLVKTRTSENQENTSTAA